MHISHGPSWQRALACLALSLAPFTTSFAATSWIVQSGDWKTAANWSGSKVPTSSADAVVDNGGNAFVSTGGATAFGLYAGFSGSKTGSISVPGGSISVVSTYLGYDPTGRGSGDITKGTWTNSSNMYVGYGGVGNLNVQGGTITDSNAFIGYNAGSSGTATVSGGIWKSTLGITVGLSGTGVLTITDSGVVSMSNSNNNKNNNNGTGTLVLAANANSVGILNLGNGAAAGSLQVGTVSAGSGTARVNFNHTGTSTFAPTLTGTMTVSRSGNGTTILSANNSYVGGTFINSGTLQLGVGGTTGSLGTGAVANNGALAINRTGTLALTNDIFGGGGLVHMGSGTTIVSGNNTYTGSTSILKGALQIDANARLGTGGALYVSGGGVRYGAAFNDLRAITVGTGGATIDTNGFDVLYSSGINGTGGFTKSGTGTLTLIGANNYTGQTTISGGTLKLGSGFGFGSIGNGKVTNNGVLAFDLPAGGTFANQIDGKGSLTQSSNLLTLTGTNSYEGGNLITGGILRAGNAKALGSAKGNMTITFGALDVNGFNIQVATLSGGTNAVITSTVGSGTLATNSDQTGVYAGVITNGGAGTLALLKSGKGALTLSGSNSYTGGTTLNGGSLLINNAHAFGTGAITFTGNVDLDNVTGTSLTLATNNAQFWNSNFGFIGTGDLNLGTGNVVMNNSRNVNVKSGTLTVGGVISAPNANVGLTKSGTGTLLLTNNNTYLGTTAIDNNGTLQIGNGGTAGSIASTKITNNGQLVFNRSNNVTISGLISGKGIVTQAGTGTLTLTGTNTYTGGTLIRNGGAIRVGTAKALGVGNLGLLSSTLDLNGFAVAVNSITGDAGALITNYSPTAAVLTSNADSNTVYAGAINDGTGTVAFVLSSKGNGSLTLTGSNNYSGGTTLNSGGLNLGNANAIGTGALTIVGGTLDNTTGAATTLATNNAQNWNGNFAFKGTHDLNLGTGTVVMNGTRTVTVTSGTLTVGGDLTATSATYGLVKSGTGTLVLNGNNTYGGATTINQGTLQLGSGGTLNFLSSGIANNGALIFNHSNTLFYRGVISGKGALQKDGTGLLFLSGVNSYTGGTVVNSGTLRLGNIKALGATSGSLQVNDAVVELNGGAVGIGTLAGSGTLANFGAQAATLTTTTSANSLFSGLIADSTPGAPAAASLALVKAGNGNLTLSGNNTYTGGTTITAGTLTLGNGGSTGTIVGGVTNNGILAFNYGTMMSFDGLITGKGSVQQIGTTTLTLTANNNYTGGTTIGAAGALHLVDGGFFGTGNINNNGAILFDYDISNLDVANVINGIGTVVQNGLGVLNLKGANNYSGGTVINSGTVFMGNAKALGATTGNLSVNDGLLDLNNNSLSVGTLSGGGPTAVITNSGTLLSNKPITVTTTSAASSFYAGSIQNGVVNSTALTKAGTGTLALTGNNTYTGGTVINGGVLSIGNGGTTGSIVGNVSNKGTLAFNRSNAYTFAGEVSGAGSLVQAGSGTLTLTGSNSYTGGTILQSGGLAVGNASALGKGSVTLSDGDLMTDGTQRVINITGNLIWNSDAVIHLTVTPNSDSEYVAVSGQFLLQGNSSLVFDLTPVGLPPGHTSFLLMTVASGFNGLTEANFSFVSDDPGFEGTFRISGTELWFDDGYEPGGSSLSGGLGGPAVVPEPSTYVLLALGLVALMARMIPRSRAARR